jgi:hypothetical protein
MKTTALSLTIDGEVIPVRPSQEHEYLLETKLVAKGYGVPSNVIRNHKDRNREELVEGKHFLTATNCGAGNGNLKQILWTKRGIIRLGFFIKSERAKKFRDAAEDLIIRAATAPKSPVEGLPEVFEYAANALRSGQTIAQALAIIAPAMPYGAISRATGKPRERLVPAYYTSRFVPDARTIEFLASHGLQLDFTASLIPSKEAA